jgi:formamidopyrimidine-DNA glycosylase
LPELPEVEVVSRLLGQALSNATVESVIPTGVSTLKSFDPPISQIAGHSIESVRRRGKHLIIDFDDGLSLLLHLMSAGRLQLFDKHGSLRDKTSRLLIRLGDGRELRLREFGTRQSSWAKLLVTRRLDSDEAIATLGPEAWPDPPPFEELLKVPRPLNSLIRDQQVIAGIGRSWADEILHQAMLSPFKRGDDLTDSQADDLRTATIERLGSAIEHYEQVVQLPIPDKLPMPLQVHRRAGLQCPRCGSDIRAVYFEGHEMCYCPQCQTEGRVLKDRRLSRLVK